MIASGADGRIFSSLPSNTDWNPFGSSFDVRAAWPGSESPVVAIGAWEDIPSWIAVRAISDGHELLRVEGPTDDSRFGLSVAFIDDVNGDSTPDIAVGRPGPMKAAALPGGIPVPPQPPNPPSTTRPTAAK